jgi:hypothetical protein
LSATENQNMKLAQQQQQQARNLAFPYFQSRLAGGLPFFNSMTDFTSGQNAQAFAPARAQILRDTSRYGTNMPSGYRDSLLAGLDANRARGFDQGLMQNLMLQETAKNNAAQGIMGQQQLANPLGWAGAQGSANQSIMQAPLSSPGIGGILGGIAGAGLGAAGSIWCPARGSMILMFDGVERPVETLAAGDRVMGIDEEACIVEDVLRCCEDVIRVATNDGCVLRNSLSHAYALPRGGFTVASKSLNAIIATKNGMGRITSIEPDGKDDVFNILTDGSHTYRADGAWCLGVGDAERHESMLMADMLCP